MNNKNEFIKYPIKMEKGQDRVIPTFLDKIQAATFLRLVPKSVSPNNITAFRFATIPFVIYFLVAGEFRWGIVLFAIAAISDAVDGALARTRNQVTDWGKLYDPLADKLLIGSVAALVVAKYLGHTLALTIIGFELFLIVGAFYRKKFRGREIRAKLAGKIKMILQSVGVFLVLSFIVFHNPLLLDIARYFLYTSIGFAILSFIVYSI